VLAVLILLSGCGGPRKVFQEAQRLEGEGKYQEAAGKYREVGEKFPGSREAMPALLRSGELYEARLGDQKNASESYRALKAIVEGKPEAGEVILRLAKSLEYSGPPYRESLEFYGFVRKNFAGKPESAKALLATGRLYEAMRLWPEARTIYEEALRTLTTSGEKDIAWTRLQSVWLFECLGLYFSGQIDQSVTLAGDSMSRSITVPEVKRGLEVLLRRHALAKRFWDIHPSMVIAEDTSLTTTPDQSRFITGGQTGEVQEAPAGWDFSYDKKNRKFVLKEKLPDPVEQPGKSGKGGTKGGKEKKKAEKPKPWTYRSNPDYEVLGCWWSFDGNFLGWAARERFGSRRVLEVLDLKARKKWQVVSNPSSGALGEVMVFLPHSRKVVYPMRRYIVVSDIRGGSQSMLKVKTPPGKNPPVFQGGRVKSLFCSADGLELAATVAREKKEGDKKAGDKKGKNSGKSSSDENPVDTDTWKVNLTILGEE
jgi:tetratricopeptide (TPR) repeat protein